MAKKKSETVIEGTLDEITDMLQKAAQKPVAITNASIKDGMCNYGYEILTGAGAGDKIPNRKGSNIVHEDMHAAFKQLDVHLAVIDDAFKFNASHLTALDDMSAHDITAEFTVTGFKLTGKEENEGFILLGEKYVTTGSISLETPKINAGSNYPFFEELSASVGLAVEEVELYMNGKCQPKMEQGKLFDKEDNGEFDKPIE
jgi:hypothetical protein